MPFFKTFLKGSLIDAKSNNAWVIPMGVLTDSVFNNYKDARFTSLLQSTAANTGTNNDVAGYLLLNTLISNTRPRLQKPMHISTIIWSC